MGLYLQQLMMSDFSALLIQLLALLLSVLYFAVSRFWFKDLIHNYGTKKR